MTLDRLFYLILCLFLLLLLLDPFLLLPVLFQLFKLETLFLLTSTKLLRLLLLWNIQNFVRLVVFLGRWDITFYVVTPTR